MFNVLLLAAFLGIGTLVLLYKAFLGMVSVFFSRSSDFISDKVPEGLKSSAANLKDKIATNTDKAESIASGFWANVTEGFIETYEKK